MGLSSFNFYRAMLRRARSCESKSSLRPPSVRPSFCLSVTFRYCDHIGWNTSKIILRPNSLRSLLTLTPTWAIWCNGNTPKLGWKRGGVRRTILEILQAFVLLTTSQCTKVPICVLDPLCTELMKWMNDTFMHKGTIFAFATRRRVHNTNVLKQSRTVFL